MLEALKRELIDRALWAESLGLVRPLSGNFSVRSKRRQLILLTPSGVPRCQLRPSDIIVMDMGGALVECAPNRRPSSEWRMHIAAYDARPDIVAVAHTHSTFATAFAVARMPIPNVVAEMAMLNLKTDALPCAQFAPLGSADLGESVRQPLTVGDALLLAAHGVLTVSARSVDEAVLRAAYVEDIAEIYYRARLLTSGDVPAIARRKARPLT